MIMSSNTKVRNTKTTRLTIDWTAVEGTHFANGCGKLKAIAAHWGVSAPTAMKILAAHYGDRLIAKRGRTGGLVLRTASAGA
jgi:DNA-binding IscR family transcriptional regulator